MSDEDVIKKFVGDKFEADGSFQCPDISKADWFPPKGTKLILNFKTGSKVEAKIELVLPPNTFYKGKQAIEEATYVVTGDTLVNAKPLKFLPNLTAVETLVMSTNPRVMLHVVKFSDSVVGQWTCPDKS